MAVIDYTRRSERLGNLGEVRRVDRADVSAIASMGEVARSQERVAVAGADLGRTVADVGARLGKGVIDLFAKLRDAEEDRQLAKAANMVMSINERSLLSPGNEGGEGRGYLHRIGEDCIGITGEAQMGLAETVTAVGDELKLDDGLMERLRLKLSPYARSCEARLMNHETTEVRRAQVADAKALWQNELRAIAGGNNTDEMYAATIADFDHYLDVAGVTGEERRLQHGTFVASMVKADVEAAARRFGSVADYDRAIDAAKRDPASLFMGNEVLKREMGGKVGDALRDELLTDLERERDRFAGRQRHEEAVAREKLKDAFVRKELEKADEDVPATEWVKFYRDLGSDETLRKLAPDTALGYMNTAERLDKALKRESEAEAARLTREVDEAARQAERDAAQAARQEVAATEGDLARRLLDLEIRELDGDAGLQGGRLAAEQAAIWRDYKVALHSGKMRENFASTFLGRLKNRLSDQERGAMRQFYAAFGYHGDLASDGDVTAADRKAMKKDVFMSPADETQAPTSDDVKGRKLTGEQLFSLGDTFLREMRTMGPEAYRPEVIRTVIGEIKTRHMAEDFNRNRAELAQKLLNIQRNFKAGEIQNGRGNDNGNGDGNGTGGARSGREDD